MSVLLEVQALAYVSPQARVLEEVSFALARGNSLCVLGDSGSGKTMLLRLLCGLERPSEGRLFYQGEDARLHSEAQWRKLRRDMGVVLEDSGLLSDLTLAENILYPLVARGATDEQLETALQFALALFDLYAWRMASPHGLSAGIVKRALLARALITDPPLLLCDNLFDDLDAQARAHMAGVLGRQVASRGLALLYTARSEGDAALLQAEILRL